MAFDVKRPSGLDGWTDFDGRWSTFELQIGNTAGGQHFRFVPSTASSVTWLVEAGKCPDKYFQWSASSPGWAGVPGAPTDAADCARLRGVDLLDSGRQGTGYVPGDSATSHGFTGQFALEIEGQDVVERYGPTYSTKDNVYTDYIFLESNNNGTQNSTTGVPISDDSSLYFYLPSVGLGNGVYKTGTLETPSLLSTMANASIIPSLSWGYAAGAFYNNFPGSLVLGGYDMARLQNQSRADFKMSEQELVVNVLSIDIDFKSTSPDDNPDARYDQPFEAVIDSSLPYIYLPPEACDMFVRNFRLQGNNSDFGLAGFDLDIYTLSREHAQQNERATEAITFNLGDPSGGKQTVAISLPYSAFNSNASWVYGAYDNSTTPRKNLTEAGAPPLFPIKRLAAGYGGGKAILGRAFLQEAYIHANFEKREFFVARANFSGDPDVTELVTVTSSDSSPPGSNKLSTGAIAGIAVGAVIGVGFIIGLCLWFFMRKRKQRRRQLEEEASAAKAKEEMELEEFKASANKLGGGRGRASSAFSDAPTEVDAASPLRPGHHRLSSNLSELSATSDEGRGPRIGGWLNTVDEHHEGAPELENKNDYARLQEYSQRAKVAGGSGQASPQPPTPLTPPTHELEASTSWLYPNQRQVPSQMPEAHTAPADSRGVSPDQSPDPGQSPHRGPSPIPAHPSSPSSPQDHFIPAALRVSTPESRRATGQ